MPGVKARDNESLDFLMRKLKRAIEKSGLLQELRKREYYEPPSKIRKRNIATAKKRMQKKVLREKTFLKKGNKNLKVW